jgi:hypothetical protein
VPATKLEAFQSRTGVVLIRGYSTVGTVSLPGREVAVDARELRDGSSPESPLATGVSITIREVGTLERENTSYIDIDEVDALVKGIEYVSGASKDVTKLDQFEVEYRTRGDLRITVFSGRKGKILASISSGTIGRTIAFVDLKELAILHDLILAAKSKL